MSKNMKLLVCWVLMMFCCLGLCWYGGAHFGERGPGNALLVFLSILLSTWLTSGYNIFYLAENDHD